MDAPRSAQAAMPGRATAAAVIAARFGALERVAVVAILLAALWIVRHRCC
jgi:hypothetical protein